jgi:hypothetical protein
MPQGAQCSWPPEPGTYEIEEAARLETLQEPNDPQGYALWYHIFARLWETYTPLTYAEKGALRRHIASGLWPDRPVKDYFQNARTARS